MIFTGIILQDQLIKTYLTALGFQKDEVFCVDFAIFLSDLEGPPATSTYPSIYPLLFYL